MLLNRRVVVSVLYITLPSQLRRLFATIMPEDKYWSIKQHLLN